MPQFVPNPPMMPITSHETDPIVPDENQAPTLGADCEENPDYNAFQYWNIDVSFDCQTSISLSINIENHFQAGVLIEPILANLEAMMHCDDKIADPTGTLPTQMEPIQSVSGTFYKKIPEVSKVENVSTMTMRESVLIHSDTSEE